MVVLFALALVWQLSLRTATCQHFKHIFQTRKKQQQQKIKQLNKETIENSSPAAAGAAGVAFFGAAGEPGVFSARERPRATLTDLTVCNVKHQIECWFKCRAPIDRLTLAIRRTMVRSEAPAAVAGYKHTACGSDWPSEQRNKT